MTRNGSQELELWVQKDIHREGNESHVAFHGKGNVRQEGVLDGSFYVQILQSGCLVTDYSSAASQKPLVQPTLLIVLSSDNWGPYVKSHADRRVTIKMATIKRRRFEHQQ